MYAEKVYFFLIVLLEEERLTLEREELELREEERLTLERDGLVPREERLILEREGLVLREERLTLDRDELELRLGVEVLLLEDDRALTELLVGVRLDEDGRRIALLEDFELREEAV